MARSHEADDSTENATTPAERFPRDGLEYEPGDEIAVDAGVLRERAFEPGSSASQICTVTDVDGDELTVEYGSTRDRQTGTVATEWVRDTTLEEGDDVVVSYDSKYTADDAPRTEKTGTVRVVTGRRDTFRAVAIDLDGSDHPDDDGRVIAVHASGSVTNDQTRDVLGDDAIVELAEDADEWDPEPAELRDGETVDRDSHAQRNAEQLEIAREELEDDDPEPVTDGGVDRDGSHVVDVDESDRDTALLDSVFDGSHNFKKARVHTSRHGLEGYQLHFGGEWLFDRTVDEIRAYGFEIDSMSMSSHVDGANFRVLVERTREPTVEECLEIDVDHYLIPDEADHVGRGVDVATDGGFATDDERAEWCAECSRYRISCAHDDEDEPELVTDGGKEYDVDAELEDERVLVNQYGPPEPTKRTGEVIEIQLPEDGVQGHVTYVVDLDAAGHAHVTRDALIRVDEIPLGGVLMSSEDAAVAFDAVQLALDVTGSEWVVEVDSSVARSQLADVSRTLGTQLAVAGQKTYPEAGDEQVTVDRDVLEELVDVAKGKLEGDVSRHGPDGAGYDVDAFAETIELAEESLD